MPSMPPRVMLLWLCVLALAPPVRAHSPHDVIHAVSAVARVDGPPLVFAAVADDVLMRSSDGGQSWADVTRGLDNHRAFTSIDAASGPAGIRVVVGTDGDGVFGSRDGGDTWQPIAGALADRRIRKLWLLENGEHVLAITRSGGLYRSADFGESWGALATGSAAVTALSPLADEGHARLAIGTADGRILVSKASTSEWGQASVPASVGAVTSLRAEVVDGQSLVLAGTELAGVLRSTDGGKTFQRATSGLTDRNIRAVVMQPGTATAFAVGWNEAAFRSRDGGATWTRLGEGLTTDKQANDPMHFSPQFIDMALVPGGKSDPVLFIAGFDGLFRSADGGGAWTQLETLSPGRIFEMVVSPSAGGDHCLALSTYGAGIYLRCARQAEWQVLSRGLSDTRIMGMTFSTGTDGRIVLFACLSGQLLTHRGTREAGWQVTPLHRGMVRELLVRGVRVLHARLGLPRSMTLDLLDKHSQAPIPEALAVPSGFSLDSTIYLATFGHGVIRASARTGEITVLRDSDRLMGKVLLSPAFDSDRTLVVSARQEGILVSHDGGDSWQAANQGLGFLDAWRNFEKEPDRLHEVERSAAFQIDLAVSPEFERDGTLFAGSSAGLYRSTDGAASWMPMGRGFPTAIPYVLQIAVSPRFKADRTLVVSVKGEGLFVSRNGGESFSRLGDPDQHARLAGVARVVFSPDFGADKTIYAASESDVFLSADEGRTWTLLDRPLRYEGTRGVVSSVADLPSIASAAGAPSEPGSLSRHRGLECASHRLSVGVLPAQLGAPGATARSLTLDAIDVLGGGRRRG